MQEVSFPPIGVVGTCGLGSRFSSHSGGGAKVPISRDVVLDILGSVEGAPRSLGFLTQRGGVKAPMKAGSVVNDLGLSPGLWVLVGRIRV